MTFNSHAAREENAMEELQLILRQEATIYGNQFDYLSYSDDDLPQNERVSDGWRRKICEWLFEVVDHFRFDREVVSIALFYLDRVVSIQTKELGHTMNRREYQLVAVTSLYIAIKLHGEVQLESFDMPRRKLKIDVFVELSRGLFTVNTLEEKEMEILKMLNWHVNPTSSAKIIASLLHFFPEKWSGSSNVSSKASARASIYELARYLTELSVCVSSIALNCKASEVAYASILCAIDALKDEIYIPDKLQMEFENKVTAATRLTPNTVKDVRASLQDLCPSMFSGDDNNVSTLSRSTAIKEISPTQENESDHGKISPVCVMNQCGNQAISRKRVRK
mmetsp:Transcript_18818/g.27828  ORF Transcript_18818/g.27828 Transcript_18818/m.27828 type:complete len:336 (-) Transcript_18818:168-1175(-)|eukprot:CAMPEP_0194206878 /NCGR_PEP_ID=MMETSP0156-20130528/5791_1 /TAXON_ID=33649 /ORGANISM="Thalassionema nitzschioides, Strain L26-B" /LENGTH=335 /DNA_ID=CAMNT_0038933509 /DNA_START=155 /DNA_END=1162 /DNA_ORIENTATION=-